MESLLQITVRYSGSFNLKKNPSFKNSDRSAVHIMVSCQMRFAGRKSMDIELQLNLVA